MILVGQSLEEVYANILKRQVLYEILEENRTDFIICQKGKSHYKIVGYHKLNVDGDTTIVLELGERIEGENNE